MTSQVNKPKVEKPQDQKVNPKGERVTNGRSHVQGAGTNGDQDIDLVEKKRGIEPQKRTR